MEGEMMTHQSSESSFLIAQQVAEALHVDSTRAGTARLAKALIRMMSIRRHDQEAKPSLPEVRGLATRDMSHRRVRS